MYCERMQVLYDAWVASSYDKQHARQELDFDAEWSCDVKRGMIRADFPTGHSFEESAQFLGRESDCGELWTWAWAFPAGEVPERSLEYARRLRDYGRREELLALIVPSFELRGRCGHQLAAIASGLTTAKAYVDCETDDGTLYFLREGLFDLPKKEDPVDRIFRIFPEVVRRPDIPVADHRAAFRSYLEFYGLEVATHEQGEGTVISGLVRGTKRVIVGGFDKDGRALGLAEAVRRRRRRRPSSS